MTEDIIHRRLFNHIESNMDSYVYDLVKLVRQRSISAHGEGIAECIRITTELIKRLGLNTQVCPIEGGHPVIYAKSPESSQEGKGILMYNHYDVQPPDPINEWSRDPFSGDTDDEKIYGRGVADDKGDLVARLSALTSVKAVLGEIPIPIKWVIEGEEEIGSPNIHKFIENNKKELSSESCIWEAGDLNTFGTPEFFLGCKGLVYVELSLSGTPIDKHSKYAAILESPVWRMVSLLRSLKNNEGEISLEGFYNDVETPSKEEMDLISNIQFDERSTLNYLGAKDYLYGMKSAEILRSFIYSPTCNIAGISSGYSGPGSKTILPSKAIVKIDFRLVPNQTSKKILHILKNHLNKHGFEDAKIIVHGLEDPAKTPLNNNLVKRSSEAAKIVYGIDPVIWPMMPATGPMALFKKELNIPVAMVNVIPYAGSSYHGPNEHIRLEDYKKGIKHFAALITGYKI